MDKELYTASFSDSLVLFSKDNSPESLDIIASSAAYILHDALLKDIPMKGAIAYGKISVNKEKQIYNDVERRLSATSPTEHRH